MPFIELNRIPLPFCVKRSAKAKRLRITLKCTFFEVVAPLSFSSIEVLKFVWYQRNWMAKHLRGEVNPLLEVFLPSEGLPYRGHQLKLQVKYGLPQAVIFHETSVQVQLPWMVRCEQMESWLKEQILSAYRQQALKAIQATLDYFCPRLGRWPVDVALKQQKTLWGSCSAQQKISINWLLILAPFGVLEYVVVHELCHLFHPNHSQRFWKKVGQYMPDYERPKQWLKKWGKYLLI